MEPPTVAITVWNRQQSPLPFGTANSRHYSMEPRTVAITVWNRQQSPLQYETANSRHYSMEPPTVAITVWNRQNVWRISSLKQVRYEHSTRKMAIISVDVNVIRSSF